MNPTPTHYSGRFAPSPTGPLHAGSLVAALASFLDARANGGRWSLRIDDIDPPRAVAGAVDQIIQCLHDHALQEDGAIQYQSQRSHAYDQALSRLAAAGHTFRCRCTRSTLVAGQCVADCSEVAVPPDEPASIRIRVPPDTEDHFEDRVLGHQGLALGSTCANFILKRRDGLYAYQLACAVDDGDPSITHVVRGADLLDSTHRQRFVQHCLGLASPIYGHVPVVTDHDGNKLSKQTGAKALEQADVCGQLMAALTTLGQTPPQKDHDPAAILTEAVANWSIDAVPR